MLLIRNIYNPTDTPFSSYRIKLVTVIHFLLLAVQFQEYQHPHLLHLLYLRYVLLHLHHLRCPYQQWIQMDSQHREAVILDQLFWNLFAVARH